MKTVFAIAGMGLSGNALFCHLVNRLTAEPQEAGALREIQVFEPDREHLATGAPYGIECPPVWTLNNPAQGFSFVPGVQPLHEWIAANRESLLTRFPGMDETYCPRAVTGLYLQAQYALHREKARAHGITVIERFECVSGFDHGGDARWVLQTTSESVQADYLFLCVGHAPKSQFTALKTTPGFHDALKPLDALQDIPADASVCILGHQASFIDYAVWLAFAQEHTGPIYAVTRRPSIITTKGNPDTCAPEPLQALTASMVNKPPQTVSYAEAKASFWSAYRCAAVAPVAVKTLTTRVALGAQLQKYRRQEGSASSTGPGNIDEFRAFVKGFYFNGAYEALWKALTDEGRIMFRRFFHARLVAFLTGTTPLNAALLEAMYEEGQIQEKPGVEHVDHDGERGVFRLHFQDGDTLETAHLIDASGYGYDVQAIGEDHPLLHSALTKGFIMPGRHGGVQVSDAGELLNAAGVAHAGLYCVGPLANYGHKYPTPHSSVHVLQDTVATVTHCLETLQAHAPAGSSLSA